MSIERLGEVTGLGRQVVGRIVRGETRSLDPDQANLLVAHLPITMEQLLAAWGFALGVAPSQRVPKKLVEAYSKLSPDDRRQLVRSAQALAAYPPEDDAQAIS